MARFGERKRTLFKKSYEIESHFDYDTEVRIKDGDDLYCYRSAGWVDCPDLTPTEVQGPGDFITHNEAIRSRNSLETPITISNRVQHVPEAECNSTTEHNRAILDELPYAVCRAVPQRQEFMQVGRSSAQDTVTPLHYSSPDELIYEPLAPNNHQPLAQKLNTPPYLHNDSTGERELEALLKDNSPPTRTLYTPRRTPEPESMPLHTQDYSSRTHEKVARGLSPPRFDVTSSPSPPKRPYNVLLGMRQASTTCQPWTSDTTGSTHVNIPSKRRRTNSSIKEESALHANTLGSIPQYVPPPPSLMSPLRSTSNEPLCEY